LSIYASESHFLAWLISFFVFVIIGKYNRGKYVDEQWVFGGVERGTGRCFLVVVKDRSEAKLLELIIKWIFTSTIILSDCWKAYSNIRWDF
jgi:transposase-like protein